MYKRKLQLMSTVVAVIAAGAALQCGLAQADSAFPMQEFNVIVLGNVKTGASVGTFNDTNDIQGNAFINGSVAGSTFAGNDLPTGSTTGLEATGSITDSVNVNGGANVILGGTLDGNKVNNAGTISQNSTQPATDLANFSSTLTAASNYWASLPATTTVSLTSNQMTFNVPANAGNLVVFDISAYDLANQSGSIIFNGIGTNQQVLINVSIPTDMGTTITESSGLNSNFTTMASNIIWNFNTATSITLNGIYGSILAPLATLSSGSTITGNIAVANLGSVGEIDFASPNFPSSLTAIPTPEPAALGVVSLIGAGILLVGRKRKNTD